MGEQLRLADGSAAYVTSVTATGAIEPVYNFSVDGWHTYHVGELGVWVHNICLTPHEREIKSVLEAGGRNVQVVERAAGKTPDFIVDGVHTEVKEVTKSGTNTVKNQIQDALRQVDAVGGGNMIIDTRRFAEMDTAYLMQQARRVEGNRRVDLTGRVSFLTAKGWISY